MKSFELDDIEPGTVFESRVFTPSGLRLAEPFTPLNEERIEQLRDWNVTSIQTQSEPIVVEDQPESREEGQAAPADTEPVAEESGEQRHPDRQFVQSKSEGLKHQIRSSYRDCLERTTDLLRPISKGMVNDSKRIYQAIQPLTESIWHLPRMVLFLLADQKTDRDREYINVYSLNTAIFSMLVAREMGIEQDEARLIGASALVHDIGMLKIPQHIRKKEGEFSTEEREKMESHPEKGARILRDIENLELSIATVASEHHEQYDGGGYPRGLKSDEIHSHARIVHLTMTFTAMTQPRHYRSGKGTIESIQSILEEEQKKFDPEVLGAFLRLVGIYPVGTFVELESGCHALVVKPDPDNQYQPRVQVIADPDSELLDEPYLVDLAEDDDEIDNILPREVMGYSALEMA